MVNPRFEPHIISRNEKFQLDRNFSTYGKKYQKQTHFREKNEKIENLLTFLRSRNVIKRNF
jgi:hypothetical protein